MRISEAWFRLIQRPVAPYLAPLRALAMGAGSTALLAMMVACSQESAKGSLEAAEAAIKSGEHRTAIVHLKGLIQKDPNNAKTRFLLGKSLVAIGDMPGARIELQKAKEGGYPADEVWPVLGVAMTMMGDGRRFIQEASDVQLGSPKAQAELMAVVATAHGLLGQSEQAGRVAEEALRIDAESVEARLVLVRVAMEAGDLTEARKRLNALLERNPKSATSRLLEVELLGAERAEVSAKVKALQAVLEVDPDNLQALGSMALQHAEAKDFEAAQGKLDRLQRAHPRNPFVRYYKAIVALIDNKLDAATAEVEQLVKAYPDETSFRYLAGAIAYQRGSYLQASAHLSQAASDRRALRQVRMLLARSYLRLGEASRALIAIRPLMERKDADAEVFGIAAEAYLQQGDVRTANGLFERAVRQNPGDVAAKTSLAWAQMQSGSTQQGLEALAAVSATDQAGISDMALISAHIAMRRLPEALAAITVLERKLPGRPFVATMRGRVELMRGNVAEARKQFEAALSQDRYHLPAVNALAVLDIATGNRKAAEERYQAVVGGARSSLEAELALLGMRMEEGLPYDQLVEMAKAVIARYADDPQGRLALIRIHEKAGRFKEAVLSAQEGVAAFPGEPLFLDALAHAHFKLGDMASAMQAASKMAALQPGSPIPFFRMAEMAYTRRDSNEAISHLQRAVSLRPDYLPAQQMMVELHALNRRFAQARSMVATIQKQRPGEPEGWMLAGDLDLVENKVPAALDSYRESLKRGGASQVAMKYHTTLGTAKRYEDRQRFEESWLAQHPGDNQLRMAAADAAMVAGEFDRAETLLTEVLRLAPNHVHALNNLAWVTQRSGRLQDARAHAERAAKLAPDSAPVLDTLAGIQADLGLLNQALQTQRDALSKAPGVHIHRLHLAQFLAKAGQRQEAKSELKILEGLGDKFPEQAEVKALLNNL